MKCENMKPDCFSDGGVYTSEADIHNALCKARTQDIDIYCYENLANAIVTQAAEDYKEALHDLDGNPNNDSAKHDAYMLEKFFRSPWYHTLTKIDGEYLINRIKATAEEYELERLRKKINRKIKEIENVLNAIKSAGGNIDAETRRYLSEPPKTVMWYAGRPFTDTAFKAGRLKAEALEIVLKMQTFKPEENL